MISNLPTSTVSTQRSSNLSKICCFLSEKQSNSETYYVPTVPDTEIHNDDKPISLDRYSLCTA
jgi:hypothetical protein